MERHRSYMSKTENGTEAALWLQLTARGPVTIVLSFLMSAVLPIHHREAQLINYMTVVIQFGSHPPIRKGANVSEIIQFIPKSERERVRLIQEARAIYDSIFPSADPVSELRDDAPVSHTVSGANASRGDGVIPSS
jgi:hypothetical protein